MRSGRRKSPSAGAIVAALFCVLCIVAAPWLYFPMDVKDYAAWARATGGAHPWNAYSSTESNYPPLLLYLLTVIEAVRTTLHAARLGPITITLIKLPSLIACGAGIPLCWYGLREIWGKDRAFQAALAWALCTPLWYNAGLWGQTDALLTFGLVTALIATLNQRPAWAGFALGLALSLKVMAVILIPVMAVFLLRRMGVRALAKTALFCLATWLLVVLPFVAAGHAEGVVHAYRGAVGFMSFRQISALNGWYLLDYFDVHFRHLPSDWTQRASRLDTRLFLDLVSYRALGLGLFAISAAGLIGGVWRRPTDHNLTLSCGLIFFAFFMLTTEMHERYLVPAAGLMTLIPASAWRERSFSAAVGVCALLNQILRGAFQPGAFAERFTAWQTFVNDKLAFDLFVSAASCILLVVGLRMAWRYQFSHREPAQTATDPLTGAMNM